MPRVWPSTLSAYEFAETRGKPKVDQLGEHIGGLEQDVDALPPIATREKPGADRRG